MAVNKINIYPDYSGFIPVIKSGGITDVLLNKIITKHQNCRERMMGLYGRYKTMEEYTPIFNREPRFKHEDPDIEEINNRVNNDFFSEIIDIKTGYFAGKAAVYSYSDSDESEEDTGGEEAMEVAAKALNDFVMCNNMYDVDMECTRLAAVCGYAGRLLYVDTSGNERIMVVDPCDTIILYTTEMTEPVYAVRYYPVLDINDVEYWKAEFYDDKNVYYYEGQYGNLALKEVKQHLFDCCPLQGVPNNRELLGDAEKVVELIDNYDRAFSDNSNDIEGNTSAHMIFQNVIMDDTDMAKARKSGAFQFDGDGKVYYLTKDINDTFNSNHLKRTEENIYRFSKTPNFSDENFGTAAGIALKIRMTGLESKCGSFEAKLQSANVYMFKCLATSFVKKRISFDPLQCFVKYKRNFPLDIVSESQAVATLLGAGLPKQVAFAELSFIDDIDYVMDLIEQEKDGIAPLEDEIPEDKPPQDEDVIEDAEE